MQYVNGGHNAPLLRHADGLYEYIYIYNMPGINTFCNVLTPGIF